MPSIMRSRFDAGTCDMDFDGPPTQAQHQLPSGAVQPAGPPALHLSHDELRHVFQFVPALDRWAGDRTAVYASKFLFFA